MIDIVNVTNHFFYVLVHQFYVFLYFQEFAEVEMMKERFAKLLLGEDMSGGDKGVCTALAISNAITNLSGQSIFSLFIFSVGVCMCFRISSFTETCFLL